jgi:hypothetical protein
MSSDAMKLGYLAASFFTLTQTLPHMCLILCELLWHWSCTYPGRSRKRTVRDGAALPGAHWGFCNSQERMANLTDGIIVKKFTYSIIGLFLFLLSGTLFSGALEFHNALAEHMQRFDSFPESGWLIVLGVLLISWATVLRRRHAAARTR